MFSLFFTSSTCYLADKYFTRHKCQRACSQTQNVATMFPSNRRYPMSQPSGWARDFWLAIRTRILSIFSSSWWYSLFLSLDWLKMYSCSKEKLDVNHLPKVKKLWSWLFSLGLYLSHMEMLKSSEHPASGQAVPRSPKSTHPLTPSSCNAWPLSPLDSRLTPPCALPQPTLPRSFNSSKESRTQ